MPRPADRDSAPAIGAALPPRCCPPPHHPFPGSQSSWYCIAPTTRCALINRIVVLPAQAAGCETLEVHECKTSRCGCCAGGRFVPSVRQGDAAPAAAAGDRDGWTRREPPPAADERPRTDSGGGGAWRPRARTEAPPPGPAGTLAPTPCIHMRAVCKLHCVICVLRMCVMRRDALKICYDSAVGCALAPLSFP